MTFQDQHSEWLQGHASRRDGERLRRLEEGHAHAEKLFLEKVWHPAFRQFDYLHPEYEVADYEDGRRFLDFAYIRHPIKLALEVDGFGPHAARQSRRQFADALMRQNDLVMDGWDVLRFSHDDVLEKPRKCQQILQQYMGSRFGESGRVRSVRSVLEEEVLRLAIRSVGPVRPADVSDYLQIHRVQARKLLQGMVEKRLLFPAGDGTQRILIYRVNPDRLI